MFIGLCLLQRGLHIRNKMALEYIAKGWNALKEVDRVINYCEPRDKRLIPHLKVNEYKTILICIYLDIHT